jgi:glycosyltransferase involved in cell wall biosynthesis
MIKKILLISEALSAPFDEGIKNVAFSLYSQLKMKSDLLSVTKEENDTDNLEISKIVLNKLFFNNILRKQIKRFSPDIILYLPEASITFNSFLRAKVLKHMNRLSQVVMLGIQHREYSSFQKNILTKYLKPDLLLLLERNNEQFFVKKGVKIKILPPAVNSVKFCKASKEEKERIRFEYNIPKKKTVVLHVGHIKVKRNIECLLEIQKMEDIQVVIVGSTSIFVDKNLKDSLVRAGICVIDEFVPDISKIYKMSDVYVFPVINNDEAIGMPLSILEAMACNLPVITTRFGGLVDNFKEDSGYRYFDTTEEFIEKLKLIKDLDSLQVNNDNKVESFTWDRFVNEILVSCEEVTLPPV